MDKAQMVEEIGRVQGEITRAEQSLRKWEREYDAALRHSWLALFALLIGIAGILSSSWFMALWFGAAITGCFVLLFLLAESIRRGKIKRHNEELREIIVEQKTNLVKLQAQLVVGGRAGEI